jgi:mRNA-degrading endonuclease RelE of RelBE toxin-antitoxin system
LPWRIEWSRSALRDLEGLEEKVARRIVLKLDAASAAPHRFLKRMKASDHYSLRVGDYRVVAVLAHQGETIFIEAVGHRATVYDR